jgi:hypothetical protein
MVLRSCIVLLCLAGTISSFAQPFEGAFVTNDEGYYFRKNGDFSWYQQTTNGKQYGSGTYVATPDSILLKFRKAQRQFELQGRSIYPTISSKVTVTVNAVRARGGKPFPGLKFELPKSRVSGETDRTGTAQVEIENPLAKDNIHFEIDGYRTIDIPIELKGVNNFIAIVVDDVTKYRENVVTRYKIKRSRRTITLNDGSSQTSFRKTSRKKYLKSYMGM